MKFAFIEQHGFTWPVNVMRRMPGVSRSRYYDWRGRRRVHGRRRTWRCLATCAVSRRAIKDDTDRPGCMPPRPSPGQALRAQGHRCSRGRVERRMRRHRIRALAGRRLRPCTTDSHHYLPIAPNRIWLADVTCIATGEGWLYLAAAFDLATRKIVGRAMRTEFPRAALMIGSPAATTSARSHLPLRPSLAIRSQQPC